MLESSEMAYEHRTLCTADHILTVHSLKKLLPEAMIGDGSCVADSITRMNDMQQDVKQA